MEKALEEEVQVHQTAFSSSSSSVSSVFEDDLLTNSLYSVGTNSDTKGQSEKDALSQADDQLALGAEGNAIDFRCFKNWKINTLKEINK